MTRFGNRSQCRHQLFARLCLGDDNLGLLEESARFQRRCQRLLSLTDGEAGQVYGSKKRVANVAIFLNARFQRQIDILVNLNFHQVASTQFVVIDAILGLCVESNGATQRDSRSSNRQRGVFYFFDVQHSDTDPRIFKNKV